MMKKWRTTFFGILLFLITSPTGNTYASTGTTSTNITVSNMSTTFSGSETSGQGSTVVTVTGQNLPILNSTDGTYVDYSSQAAWSGYVFNNLEMMDESNTGVRVGNLPNGDYPIVIQSSTATSLVFSVPTNLDVVWGQTWALYLAPAGQTITGVPPSATYLVGVENFSNGLFTQPVNQAPTVTVSGTTQTSISLSWNAGNQSTSYNIYENGSSTPAQTGITGTTTTLTGLTPGSTYTFQVAGVNTAGTGPLSTPISATPSFLAAPVVSVNVQNSGTLNLVWSPVPNAVSYTIDVNGQSYVSNVQQTYLTLSNLPLNSAATITVYAMDANGNPGTSSTPQTATPELAGPQLSYSNLTTKSITLNWSPVSGATSYHVYEGDPTLVATTSGTSTTITGLTAGQPYSFTVQAVTAIGNSLTSAPVAITAPIVDWGFSGTDVLANALLIVASLGSLLLLALAIEFVPRLWGLLPLTESPQVRKSDEYKQEWDGAPSSSRTDISPVKFDDGGC